jgi:hypothetical protein
MWAENGGVECIFCVRGKEKEQHAHNAIVISNSNLPKVEFLVSLKYLRLTLYAEVTDLVPGRDDQESNLSIITQVPRRTHDKKLYGILL